MTGVGLNRINYWTVKEPVPDAKWLSGVWEKTAESNLNGFPFLAYHQTPGGSSCSQHRTRDDAHAALLDTIKFHQNFWEEKIKWAEGGDVVPDTVTKTLRVGGRHYTAMPDDYSRGRGAGYGHSGHTFYWRWVHPVDGDLSTRIYRSNNVWSQGEIPPEFRDRLPDNAVWATKEEWETQNSLPKVESLPSHRRMGLSPEEQIEEDGWR